MVSNGLGLLTYAPVVWVFPLAGFLLASDRSPIYSDDFRLSPAVLARARRRLERTSLFSILNGNRVRLKPAAIKIELENIFSQ